MEQKLKYNPFKKSECTSYFSGGTFQVIDSIENEIKDRKRIIILLGAEGAGKTCGITHLAQNLGKSGYKAISIKLDSGSIVGVQFFRALLQALTGEKPQEKTLNKLICKANEYIRENSEKYVLFVDNALYLKDNVDYKQIMDWFYEISGSRDVFFRIVLAGESELGSIMYRSFVLAKPFMQYIINPMDPGLVKAYIQHKLEPAGGNTDELFSGDALHEIYEYSGGLPGNINEICAKCLDFIKESGIKMVNKEAVINAPENKKTYFKVESKRSILDKLIIGDPISEPMIMEEESSDKELYDEIISFTKKIFDKKGDKIYLMDVEGVKESVSRIVDNMMGGDSKLLMLTRGETPENYLLAHTVNVCILAIKIGMGMGYGREHLHRLGIAAFLHDVGMIDNYNILSNDKKLEIGDMMEIKKHPDKGGKILSNLGKIHSDGNIHVDAIQQHHERFDGSGYPRGLRNGDIDSFARIIGIADVYEALTHGRKHRDAMVSTEALSIILRTGDDKFGPDMVKALVKELTFYPVGTFVKLNTGEIAQVIRTSKKLPTKPEVKILFNSRGVKTTPREVNLADSEYTIKSAIDEKKLQYLRILDS